MDIADVSALPLKRLAALMRSKAELGTPEMALLSKQHPELAIVTAQYDSLWGSRRSRSPAA